MGSSACAGSVVGKNTLVHLAQAPGLHLVDGTEPGKVLAAFIPGSLERSFEEFAQLWTEQGEDASRSTGRGSKVAEMNEKVAEMYERYDSEFVGPPL